MSGFKNLYAILGISPLSDAGQIQAALKNAAMANKVTLEDAQHIKRFLLNAETRKKYDAKLFAEFPEVLQQVIDAQAQAKADQMRQKPVEPVAEKPVRKKSRTLTEMRQGKKINRPDVPKVKKPFLAFNSKMTPMYNEHTGEMKTAYVGATAAPIALGILTPLLAGDILGFFVCLGFAVAAWILFAFSGLYLVTMVIFNIVLCFVYCNNYAKRLLHSGYKLSGTTEQNERAARELKIKLTLNNTVSD